MPLQSVADAVYSIPLAWGNAYVLKAGRDVALIDCGLRKDRPALLAGLRELGIEPAEVRLVLLTHAHCDHAGNAAFFAAQGADILVHAEEARFLQPPRRSYAYSGLGALQRPFTSLAFAVGEVTQPVERCEVARIVVDGDVIQAPGGDLRVTHSPGHTPGHIAFYREHDQVLFSGDAILNIIPIKRVTGLSLPMRLLTDDWEQAKRSARQLAALAPRLLLAGHGRPLMENTADALHAWSEEQGGRMKDEG